MSNRINSTDTALASADELAQRMVLDQSLDAEQTVELNKIKTAYKERRDGVKKEIKSLKSRITTWIRKHATRLFDGNEFGTTRTNLIEIQRRRNPVSIVPIDKSMSEEELINLAMRHEMDAVIENRPVIRKEQLEFLTDADLERIGWRRQESDTITFKPLANKDRKTTSRSK